MCRKYTPAPLCQPKVPQRLTAIEPGSFSEKSCTYTSESWHRPVASVKSQIVYQMLWLTFLMVVQRWQQPNSETVLTKVISQSSSTISYRAHTQLYETASFGYLTFSQFCRTAVNAVTTTNSKQMCNCQVQTHVYVCMYVSYAFLPIASIQLEEAIFCWV